MFSALSPHTSLGVTRGGRGLKAPLHSLEIFVKEYLSSIIQKYIIKPSHLDLRPNS